MREADMCRLLGQAGSWKWGGL